MTVLASYVPDGPLWSPLATFAAFAVVTYASHRWIVWRDAVRRNRARRARG